MPRDDVEAEMRELLGCVPSLFDCLPDEFVRAEWEFTRRLQFGDTLIPTRYKELISLAVAAVIRCPYGLLLHRQLAATHGATEAEMSEAINLASLVPAQSVQYTGLGIDLDAYAAEVQAVAAHIVVPE